MTGTVETVRGKVDLGKLGHTLTHEHILIRNQELEVNMALPEFDVKKSSEVAVAGLKALLERGISSLIDLTVIGLGRDIRAIARINEQVPEFNIVVATGCYVFKDLPTFFHNHGPDKMIDGPDPLYTLFVTDITKGIAGTGVKAGIIKIATDEPGFTPDVTHVWEQAAAAHHETGVPISTHSNAALKGGLGQQEMLRRHGVDLSKTVIGHCGDSNDLDYLQRLMDAGSFIGMDRFGLTWFATDEQRLDVVAQLCKRGYASRMTLSHDAGYYSVNSEPSYRAKALPTWKHTLISDHVIPQLKERGVSDKDIHQMMVVNPANVLARN